MSSLLDWLTILLVSAGLFFFIAGTAGLLRFPDALTRLHALTKADALAIGLVVFGLLPQSRSLAEAFKLIVIWVVLLLASVTMGPLIGAVIRRAETRP